MFFKYLIKLSILSFVLTKFCNTLRIQDKLNRSFYYKNPDTVQRMQQFRFKHSNRKVIKMHTKISFLVFSAILASGLCDINLGTFTDDVAKASVKLVGVNCMTSAVYDLEDAAAEVLYQIPNKCGQSVATSLTALLADTTKLTDLTYGIITNVDDIICQNASFDEDEDAQKLSSLACVTSYKAQMELLKATLTTVDADTTTALATKPGACSIYLNNYQLSLGNFASMINTCGQL